MSRRPTKIVWISSWERVCGIADYSKSLWPSIQSVLQKDGGEAILLSLDQFRGADNLVREVRRLKPDLVHIQHEYGVFGGKNPPFYWYPRLVRQLAAENKRPKLLATAHTVLDPRYRFPVRGRGLQIPFRFAANTFLLPSLRKGWGLRTWGGLDGAIVHSRLQQKWIEAAGTRRVQVIAHFVPHATVAGASKSELPPAVMRALNQQSAQVPTVLLVFGFFSPEKGQDLMIEAFAKLRTPAILILAGGAREGLHQSYLDQCRSRVRELGLSEKVIFTGFVKPAHLDGLYARASLAIAPFRETTGSGSLAHGFARGAPILASDLPLNRELTERVGSCLATFRSEDVEDCARQIERLLGDLPARDALKRGAREYASKFAPEAIAAQHLEFYRLLLGDTHGES